MARSRRPPPRRKDLFEELHQLGWLGFSANAIAKASAIETASVQPLGEDTPAVTIAEENTGLICPPVQEYKETTSRRILREHRLSCSGKAVEASS